MKIVKCRYINCNCLHDSKELEQLKAVKVGNQYYHNDCLEVKNQINEIVELFVTNINNNPVYSQLHSVIKNIVFNKKLGSDFLLFGLKYYIDHKIPLNYPQGLYYVVQNKDVVEKYNKTKTKNIRKSIEIKEDNNSSFNHIPAKNNSFEDILR